MPLCLSSAVGAPPDFPLFRFFDETVTKVRVGDGDQAFRPLPGGESLHVDDAEFCRQEIYLAARRGDDIAVKLRQHPGMKLPVFVFVGGAHADKCLAAFGGGGADEEVQLSAGSADLPGAEAL